MRTFSPVGPSKGEKELIPNGAGAEEYVKPSLEPVPLGVVIEIAPDAPAPTTAWIELEPFSINEAAFTPPNLTDIAPEKLVPVILTACPELAVEGVKLVITGALDVLAVRQDATV